MGVYIKGVKKPKSCNECYLPFLLCCEVCGMAEDLCPIVEVAEPHGDLIDRDKHIVLPKTDGKVTVVIEAEGK